MARKLAAHLLAQQHPPIERTFGINDILSNPLLGQVRTYQGVVCRRTQVGRHPFVGFDEGSKITRSVARGHGHFIQNVPILFGQRDDGWARSAFEMNVEFALGGALNRSTQASEGGG